MISIEQIHTESKMISIEQRLQKQLLWLMYLLSKHEKYIKVPARNTRIANKVNFIVPAKITRIYEHSPYYIGTKLWDNLPETTQKADNIYMFKRLIDRQYTGYKKLN